jgi:regulator of sigma E protease
VDGRPIEEWDQLVEAVADNPGRRIRLDVRRGESAVPVDVVPRPDPRGVGRIGVTQQYVYREYPLRQALLVAVRSSVDLLEDDARLLWRLARGKPGVELASPILIVKQASDAAALGMDAFLRVLVHLSLALAVFNLFPFPALDGGRMLFISIEAATGRPVNPRVETALHGSGFVLLMLLIAFAAIGDVRKLWARAREGSSGPPPSASAGATSRSAPDASRGGLGDIPGDLGSTPEGAEPDPEP